MAARARRRSTRTQNSEGGCDRRRSAEEAFTPAAVAPDAEMPNTFSSAAAGASKSPGKSSEVEVEVEVEEEASAGSEVLSRRATAAPRSGAAKSKGTDSTPQ